MAETPYARETVDAGARSAPSALVEAIRTYAEERELGDVVGAAQAFVHTTSTRERRSLGRRSQQTQESVAVVSSGMLLWAIADAGETPAVLAYELKRVEIDDYARTTLARLVADTGIEVTGAQIGATQPSAAFLGLGSGGDADRFRETLADATRLAGGTARL